MYETRPEAKAMLRGVTDIISFPEVALRVNHMVQDQSYGARQIAKEIESAPDIAAGLLRLANCAVYAFPKKIDSVHRAVSLVGNQAVRDIVLGISAKSAFSKATNTVMDLSVFWRHSICCAALAKEFADVNGDLDKEALFTAGLLHDIGQLVLYRQDPDIAKDAIQISQDDPSVLCHEVEEQRLGFHHGTLGAALAERWQFPEKLTSCIAFHHQPFLAPAEFRQEVRVVHVANALATLLETGSRELDDAAPMYPGVLDEQDIDAESVLDILERSALATGSLMHVFDLAA